MLNKPKRVALASVAMLLTVGGLAYGLNTATGRTESCPLEGTPACPKVACAQAGTPACPHNQVVAKAELSACCQAK
jgi:hypothetical protein